MNKTVSILIVITLLLTLATPVLALEGQTEFYGISQADSMYRNLAYAPDISNHWARTSLYKMGALGVITPYKGRFYPNGMVSREQALGMIINLAGKQTDAAKLATNLPGNMDNRDAWAEGYLNYSMTQGLVSAAEKANTNWRGLATRQDVAYWMSKFLGLQPVYGSEQQTINNYSDAYLFDRDKVPYIEPILANRIMVGRSGSKFLPKSGITRGEMCAVLDAATQVFLPQRKYSVVSGSVVYIDGATSYVSYSQGFYPSGASDRVVYHLVTNDRQPFTFIKDGSPAVKRDFLVLKDGKLGKAEKLAVGDNVKAIINDRGEVLWSEVAAGSPKSMYVTLESIDFDKKTINVRSLSNAVLTIPLANNYKVDMDGYPGRLEDLIGGQKVSLQLKGTQVAYIQSAVSYPDPSGPAAETRTAFGTLIYKSATEFEVKGDDGVSRIYKVDRSTVYARNNMLIGWRDMQAGDYLKFYINAANDTAYKVESTNVTNAVYAIYKAKIQSIDSTGNEMAFNDVQQYDTGSWKTVGPFNAMPIAGDAKLYKGDTRLTVDTLKGSYTGYYCYFTTATSYGKERVNRLTIKTDAERKYTGKINVMRVNLKSYTVDQVATELKYDDGTIVVKDNRLIQPESLSAGSQGNYFINEQYIDEHNNIKWTKLLVVESVEPPTSLAFYRGKITKVRGDVVTVNYYSKILNNEWDMLRGSGYTTTFVPTEDSTIMNGIVSSAVYEVYRPTFLDQGLMGDYDNALAYIIADNDNAVAMNITAKVYNGIDDREYTGERVSYGDVGSVDWSAGTVTLNHVKDWDETNDQWSASGTDFTIALSKAVIVKDKHGVRPSDIKPGDKLYILRAGLLPLMIIVQ
ncbi:MAG: S-layer homology domain-containing protein [Acidobacteriota bacterium]